MTALLGCAAGMKGGPYKLLKHLRVWKSKIGNEGTASIVRLTHLPNIPLINSHKENCC